MLFVREHEFVSLTPFSSAHTWIAESICRKLFTQVFMGADMAKTLAAEMTKQPATANPKIVRGRSRTLFRMGCEEAELLPIPWEEKCQVSGAKCQVSGGASRFVVTFHVSRAAGIKSKSKWGQVSGSKARTVLTFHVSRSGLRLRVK